MCGRVHAGAAGESTTLRFWMWWSLFIVNCSLYALRGHVRPAESLAVPLQTPTRRPPGIAGGGRPSPTLGILSVDPQGGCQPTQLVPTCDQFVFFILLFWSNFIAASSMCWIASQLSETLVLFVDRTMRLSDRAG